MALEFAHGAIQWLGSDVATTTYTVSGLSFQPKALRFYSQGIQSATDAASEAVNSRPGMGFATSTSDRRSVMAIDVDTSASMVTASCSSAVAVAIDINSTGGIIGLLDLNSITSDGFVLIVDDQGGTSYTVFWEAWGGSDITVATTLAIAEPAATGNVDYAVTGFTSGATDQVVMFAGVQCTAAAETGAVSDSGFCAGFAAGINAADNVVVMGNNDEGFGSGDCDGYCKTGECLGMITVAGGNPNARAQLTLFGTDNFRLNWIARGLTNRRYIALAIKGGNWKAGSYTIAGNSLSATATVSSLTFAPKGLSLMGRMTAEQAAGVSSVQDRMGLGSGSSTTSRRSMCHLSEDAAANAEIDEAIEYDQVLVYPSTAGAVQAAYDINAMNSDGFEIIVDVAGGVASEWQGYLTFGDAAGAPSPVSFPPYDRSFPRALLVS
jgi:hypothetical protein